MNARNPKYSRPDNSAIDLEIDHKVYGWIPFTASPDDAEEYGRNLFALAQSGEFGGVAEYVDPRTPETEWPLVRQKRNQLLLASDWTQLPDAPVATKAQWAEYRQALRDITEQPDPFSVVWPSPPAQ